MNYGQARVILSALGFAGAAFLGTACGQGDGTPAATLANQSATDALTAIQNCQAQASACLDGGDGGDDDACENGLRSCLGRSLPDGGAAPKRAEQGDDDAASKARADGHDDSQDDSEQDDASDHGQGSGKDAGGAKPALGDAGAQVQACVAALQACLATATKPTDCVDTARTCLKGIHGNND